MHGKQISQTWYPCEKKVVYRLAAQNSSARPRLDPLCIPSGGSTRSGGKRSSSTKKKSSGLESHPFDGSSRDTADDHEGKVKYPSEEGVVPTIGIKDLKKDRFFQSLLQPSRQPCSNTLTFIPLPEELSDRQNNRSRKIAKRFRVMKLSTSASSFSSAYRNGGLITGSGIDVSNPLSLLPHNLNASGELVSNSTASQQILHPSTAGPLPPEPLTRVLLLSSQSYVSGDSHTFTSEQPPAVITHAIPTPMVGATASKDETDMVNLSPRIPTMRESASHPNGETENPIILRVNVCMFLCMYSVCM